jgi:hypothetical protein
MYLAQPKINVTTSLFHCFPHFIPLAVDDISIAEFVAQSNFDSHLCLPERTLIDFSLCTAGSTPSVSD